MSNYGAKSSGAGKDELVLPMSKAGESIPAGWSRPGKTRKVQLDVDVDVTFSYIFYL